MIRLSNASVIADLIDIERHRLEFQKTGCALLPDLLDSRLLAAVLDSVGKARWEPYVDGLGSNEVAFPGLALDLLHFIVNSPRFLEVVHEITGCGPFTWIEGFVYRMAPDAGHHDVWHSDNTNGRLAALSLNLSPRGYQGGRLQIKKRGADRLLAEIANTGLGHAILFRISEDLVHHVTPVEGVEPKTAFAGWFTATAPRFADRLRSASRLDSLSLTKGAR